jgi:hypothetical protein
MLLWLFDFSAVAFLVSFLGCTVYLICELDSYQGCIFSMRLNLDFL